MSKTNAKRAIVVAPIETLEAIGEALFGAQWQRPTAGAIGVNERTLRRYVAGEREVDPAAIASLRPLLVARAKRIEALLAALPRDE